MDSASKKRWTGEEDSHLASLVNLFGTKKWALISRELKNRCEVSTKTGKQCRERWNNALNPKLVDEPWTAQEEKILFEKQQEFGNKWSQIASFLKGRSENSIKNHFYSILRKNVRRFNKQKPESEKLKGNILDLLEKEELKKILMKKPRHYYKRIEKKQGAENSLDEAESKPDKLTSISKNSLTVSINDEMNFVVCPTPVHSAFLDKDLGSPSFKALGSALKNSGKLNEGFSFSVFSNFDMTPNSISGKIFFRDYPQNLSLKTLEEEFLGRNESRKSTDKEDTVREESGTETVSRGESRKSTEKEISEKSESRKEMISENLKFPCFTPTNKFQYYETPKNGTKKFEYS